MQSQAIHAFFRMESPDEGTSAVGTEASFRLPFAARSSAVAELALQLQQLLDLGPGENDTALLQVGALVADLRRLLPPSHFREDRLRDLAADFAVWFGPGPRLQFDYNDEALRSMLLVDIHRLNTAP